MGKIVLLDELTINQIAAGEVIERPASVIKEMVENSIDAGATNISVEIRNGGISYIRITDNGRGIESDDMEIAFERHATSKIRQAEDLNAVKSMGFRGEALASIAAIANVEMISKTPDSSIGNRIVVEAGNVLEFGETACPVGTTITVQNLFFNTPVRYKFLKKDYTESGYIEDVISRLALVHPNIAFKLINSGKAIIQTSGNGKIQDVIYSIYGKDIANAVLNVDYDYEDMHINGVVGKPEIARSNRGNQLFFVNKRYVKDKTLSTAAEQSFKGLLPIGKYGFVILNINMSPSKVDVNVHPAKLEVRFQEENKVFQAIYHAIKDTLLKSELIANTEKTNEENVNNFGDNQNQFSNLFRKIQMESATERIPTEEIRAKFKKLMDNLNASKNAETENKEETKTEVEMEVGQEVTLKNEEEKQEIKLENVEELNQETKSKNETETQQEVNIENKIDIEDKETEKPTEDTIKIDNTSLNEQINQITNEEQNEPIMNNKEVIMQQEEQNETTKEEIKENELQENTNPEIEETKEEDASISYGEVLNNMAELKQEEQEQTFKEMYEKIFGKSIKENEEEKPDAISEENLISVFDNDETYSVKKNYKFIGIAFKTYIIIEIENEMYIIDQHAAHERIMYEKVKKNFYSDEDKDSQMLLLPDIITLTHKEMDIAKDNMNTFKKAGFVLEEFGENTIKLSGVPNICIDLDTKELFLETLDEINTVSRTAKQEIEEKFIATVACKAAVKAHMALTEQEVDSLMQKLLELPNPFTCPHGRPTAIKMNIADIEKKFARRK